MGQYMGARNHCENLNNNSFLNLYKKGLRVLYNLVYISFSKNGPIKYFYLKKIHQKSILGEQLERSYLENFK